MGIQELSLLRELATLAVKIKLESYHITEHKISAIYAEHETKMYQLEKKPRYFFTR